MSHATLPVAARVFQFGTSRFLQAHAALFLHEAREAGQQVPSITVVQTSGSDTRNDRVVAFNRPEGYPVIIRGIIGKQVIDRTVQVRSVETGLSCASDWEAIAQLFVEHAEFVISNTGDTGYELSPDDRWFAKNRVPISFPAKLAALLFQRWECTGRAMVVLPCELLTGNGKVLKAAVAESARRYRMPPAFLKWLDVEVAFADTLVDRIVSEALPPIGAVAEPYALWAIRKTPGVRLPCIHPDIVLTDDLEPFERLKLHILNLGHTFLAEIWVTERRADDETVRVILADPAIRQKLETLFAVEVVPGFARYGMETEAKDYATTTLDRFLNPYLNHQIADIAQHHVQKIERRVAVFLDWVEKNGGPYDAPTLKEIVARHAGTKPA